MQARENTPVEMLIFNLKLPVQYLVVVKYWKAKSWHCISNQQNMK